MRQLTIERTASIILFVLLFAMAARIPTDTDTWWHIRSGEHTLEHGMIYADPFSHTANGQPWINHSWGAQVIMALVWRLAVLPSTSPLAVLSAAYSERVP